MDALRHGTWMRRLGILLILAVALLSCGLVQVLPSSAFAQETLHSASTPLPAHLAHSSQSHADVRLSLQVPSNSTGGSTFEYVATVSNQGPDAANGTTFRVEFEPGTTHISLECTSAPTDTSGNQASCPSNVQVPPPASARPELTGHIDQLPANGHITFTVKGKFPYKVTSASTVFTAELPQGIIDDTPDTNRVEQQTTLTPQTPGLSVSVTKEQDLETTAIGEKRTYTVTYENTGDIDIKGTITDRALVGSESNGYRRVGHLPLRFSTRCDSDSSTAQCPEIASQGFRDTHEGYTITYWMDQMITIPSGKKVVIKADLVVESGACTLDGDIQIRNTAKITFMKEGFRQTESAEAVGTLKIPPCSRPAVTVTKKQDKVVTKMGEARTYTVTYENIGSDDAEVIIDDTIYFRNGKTLTVTYSTVCDLQKSTAPCPTLPAPQIKKKLQGQESNYYSRVVDAWPITKAKIPAGKKIVLTTQVHVNQDSCSLTDGKIQISNTASVYTLYNIPFDPASGKEYPYADTKGGRYYSGKISYVEGEIQGLPECTEGEDIIPVPHPSVTVKKEQHKIDTELDEERVYTVTYENTGKIDAEINIDDQVSIELPPHAKPFTIHPAFLYSYECDPQASTMPCPAGLHRDRTSKESRREVDVWWHTVTIPAGKKLVLKAHVALEGKCETVARDIIIHNEASAYVSRNGTFSNGKRRESSKVTGKIRIPACPPLTVRVEKEQDRILTEPGEERTYMVSYENTGERDADLRVEDSIFFHDEQHNPATIPFSYSYVCDSDASTMKCPPSLLPFQASKTREIQTYWVENVRIPPGKKLVVKATFTAGKNACAFSAGDIYLYNRAFAFTSAGVLFANGQRYERSEAVGIVRCTDVSTLTTISDHSPQVGDPVIVEIQVSNSVGLAEDVPFRLQLSTDSTAAQQINVLEVQADIQDITCVVESGNATCPTDFAYDAATNTITGSVAELPAGSSLKVSVRTLLTAAAKYLKTYKVYAEAPDVFGDRNLGPEGSNRSSATFSWTEKITIAVPAPPTQVKDPCGPDNAVWIKPEDSDTIRWELSDQGRRIIAHAIDGYLFDDGTTSHDYGLAHDSGELCIIPGLQIPVTGGRSADILYLTGILLAFSALFGAATKKRHDMRLYACSAQHQAKH